MNFPPIQTSDELKLIGGLDTRIAYNQEQQQGDVMYWVDAVNVEIYQGLLQKMRGSTNILTTPAPGAILGGFSYTISGLEYLIFNCGDGNLYKYDGFGGYGSPYDLTPIGKNTTLLDKTAKVQYTQMVEKIAICNGVDEIFLLDTTTNTVVPSNFKNQAGTVYGTPINVNPNVSNTNEPAGTVGYCCAVFASRLWVAQGNSLYFSDLGNPQEWRHDAANLRFGGAITKFLGNTDRITSLQQYGAYLKITTKFHTYLLSGQTTENFEIIQLGNAGIESRFGATNFASSNYFLSSQNLGVFILGQFSDLGSLKTSDSITRKITATLQNEIDDLNLEDVYMVPYAGRNQVWMYIPTNEGIQTCYVFDFNYASSASIVNGMPDFIGIYKRKGGLISCAFPYNFGVYTGTEDGKILHEDNGITFDGEGIEGYCFLPYNDFGKRSQYKRCDAIKLWVNDSKVNKFDVIFRFNQNSLRQKTKTIEIKDKYIILDQDQTNKFLLLPDENFKIITMDKEFMSVQIGFAFSGTQDFSIRAFSYLGYAILNGV